MIYENCSKNKDNKINMLTGICAQEKDNGTKTLLLLTVELFSV